MTIVKINRQRVALNARASYHRRMKTAKAIKFYGSHKRLAEALGIKPPSVHEWGEYPPEGKQILLERLTAGKLKAEPGALDRLIGADKVPA